ncbi:MAG: class II fructose-bisphosphate aldolase family protein [Candidatus Kerfeldbacteria bacterium]|nr:class II fructose-bisphosphate aldolase family protein [Candidatus Kerfeldbacteria bacterium]
MLVTLQSVLRRAQKRGYAVGAFNVSDLEQVQAVIQAAAALRAPVIVNTSEKAIAYAGLEELAVVVKTMAKKYPVPVVLDLDHGRHRRLAERCLRVGYTGLMFDASRGRYGQNIARTQQVVRLARRYGVGVEGELGQVKYPDEFQRSPDLVLTNPQQAQDFVRQTGVVALAVAIGNLHVLSSRFEHLDFRRLGAIRQRVTVPLVLHGASGMPAAVIRRAIRLGICKINIDTELRVAFSRSVRHALRQDHPYDPRDYLGPGRQAMMGVVKQKIVMFGSHRQAK